MRKNEVKANKSLTLKSRCPQNGHFARYTTQNTVIFSGKTAEFATSIMKRVSIEPPRSHAGRGKLTAEKSAHLSEILRGQILKSAFGQHGKRMKINFFTNKRLHGAREETLKMRWVP